MDRIRNLAITGQLFAILILVQGCDRDSAGTDFIDYSELDEVSTELLIEIGQREEDPIFGNLVGMVVTEDGSIVTADRGTIRIDQFAEDGEYLGAVATEGSGPGELSRFFDLILGADGGLVVQHIGTDNRVDFFEQTEEESVLQFERSVVEESAIQRLFQFLGSLSRDRYLARASELNLGVSPEQWAGMEYRESVITVIDPQSELVRDSISTLKSSFPVVEAINRGVNVIGSPPFQLHDRVKVLRGGRYLIAKPDSSEITFYNEQSEMDHRLTLKVKVREVREDEIREFLVDHDREYHQRFRDRIPEIKPPFLDVWASDSHILLKTDESGDEQEMVLLRRNGEPVGRFYLSAYDDVRWMEGDRVYSLHQNPEEGHSIRMYGLNM